MSEIDKIREEKAKLEIAEQVAIEKAFKSNNVEDIYKAQQYYTQLYGKNASTNGRKAIVIDPTDGAGFNGFYEKNTHLNYSILDKMSHTPVISSILHTRREQVSEFCTPQKDKYSKGFVIQKRRGIFDDDNNELSNQEKQEVQALVDFMINCGEDENVGDIMSVTKMDSLEHFIRKIVTDSLVFDQANAEILPTRNKDIHSFYHVDAATVRIADSIDGQSNYRNLPEKNGMLPAFVQVLDNTIQADFYPNELIFGIRNPQTSIYSYGYGRSELEDLVSVVTDLLNAQAYNSKTFTNGSFPKGFLVMKGQSIQPTKIQSFKQEWNAMMSGLQGAHKTPVLPGEDVEWIDLAKSNRDMEFKEFLEFLLRIACAIYKISPEEIGFSREGSNVSTMGRGDRSGDYEYSQTKGLFPLLRSIEGWINKWIIYPKTKGKYEFAFVGQNIESASEEEERLIQAVQNYMTVNEVRALKGMKPISNGDILLNPVYAQAVMGAQMEDGGDQGMAKEKQEERKEKVQKSVEDDPFLQDLNNYLDEISNAA